MSAVILRDYRYFRRCGWPAHVALEAARMGMPF